MKMQNLQEDIGKIISIPNSKVLVNSSSEKTKRTVKQRLGRLLMITDVKDKTLKPELKHIKDEMYNEFCRTGTWKSEDINKMFRLYANKNQDIRILKAQLKLFSKYAITVPDVATTEELRITQYIKILKFIRQHIGPMMQKIESLASEAKHHAAEELDRPELIYSDYERETEKAVELSIAKDYFKDSMHIYFSRLSPKYDQERFLKEKQKIVHHVEKHDYQDLMIFALLGFYRFGKSDDVYSAFPSDQLQDIKIAFTLPSFHPTEISLGVFLKIIEHLDSKKRFITV